MSGVTDPSDAGSRHAPVATGSSGVILRVEGLTKTYAKETAAAVADVSLDIHEGEFFSLLGPSGCGKSTTLRSIAGLEHPDDGRITLAGAVLFDAKQRIDLRADKRRIAMVFQTYAIWPHMSVFGNAAFPLQVRRRKRGGDGEPKLTKEDVRRRVMEVLELTGLAAMKDRSATQLSGGQQQRLALARAMVARPQLLILDEPLSNLDANLRQAMRSEIKRIQRESGVTVLYVTHDQNEALSLSSKIGVMDAGKVLQVGTPQELYGRPATPFVAGFVGHANMVSGVSKHRSGDDSAIEGAFGSVTATGAVPVGDRAMVALRRDRLEITAADAERGDAPGVYGRVQEIAFLGDFTEVAVRVRGTDGALIWIRIEDDRPGLAVDMDVRVEVRPGGAFAFPINDVANRH